MYYRYWTKPEKRSIKHKGQKHSIYSCKCEPSSAADANIMLINHTKESQAAHCCTSKSDNSSLPFAAAVGGTDRTWHRRSVEVTYELRVRQTHLQRQVFTQLEAVVTGRRRRSGRRRTGKHRERKNSQLASALWRMTAPDVHFKTDSL